MFVLEANAAAGLPDLSPLAQYPLLYFAAVVIIVFAGVYLMRRGERAPARHDTPTEEAIDACLEELRDLVRKVDGQITATYGLRELLLHSDTDKLILQSAHDTRHAVISAMQRDSGPRSAENHRLEFLLGKVLDELGRIRDDLAKARDAQGEIKNSQGEIKQSLTRVEARQQRARRPG